MWFWGQAICVRLRGIRMERASREGVCVCQGVKFAEMDREEIWVMEVLCVVRVVWSWCLLVEADEPCPSVHLYSWEHKPVRTSEIILVIPDTVRSTVTTRLTLVSNLKCFQRRFLFQPLQPLECWTVLSACTIFTLSSPNSPSCGPSP